MSLFACQVVHIPAEAQRWLPMVQTVWRTMVVPQLQLIDKVIDVCCAGRASSSCAVVEVTAATASCGVKLAPVAGGALCTGTEPGVDPVIRAEKGWRGRRESSLPGALPPELLACGCVARIDTSYKHTVRTTATGGVETGTTVRAFFFKKIVAAEQSVGWLLGETCRSSLGLEQMCVFT